MEQPEQEIRPPEPQTPRHPAEDNPPYRLVVWMTLLLIVGTLAFLQNAVRNQPPQDHDVTDPRAEMLSPQLKLMGRYAFGVGKLSTMGDPEANQSTIQMLSKQIEGYATTTHERVGLVSLFAELQGTEQALSYLDSLDPDLNGEQRIDAGLFRKIYANPPEPLTENEASRLATRYSWFGDLALTYGLDGQDEKRAEITQQALVTMGALAFAMFTAGGLAFLGLVLFIIALVKLNQGKLTLAYRPAEERAPGHIVYLETMAVFLVALSVVPLIFSIILPGYLVLPYLTLLGVLYWPRLRGLSWAEIRQGIGLYRGKGIIREMFFGVIGYIACLPLAAVAMMISALLIQFSGDQPSHPIMDQFEGAGFAGFAAIFVTACIIAPVLEEIMFRGALYHYLRRGFAVVASALLTGLIFAVIHPQGLVAVPMLATLGGIFALLREWRGSLIAPITAHACNNTFVMVLLFFLLG